MLYFSDPKFPLPPPYLSAGISYLGDRLGKSDIQIMCPLSIHFLSAPNPLSTFLWYWKFSPSPAGMILSLSLRGTLMYIILGKVLYSLWAFSFVILKTGFPVSSTSGVSPHGWDELGGFTVTSEVWHFPMGSFHCLPQPPGGQAAPPSRRSGSRPSCGTSYTPVPYCGAQRQPWGSGCSI